MKNLKEVQEEINAINIKIDIIADEINNLKSTEQKEKRKTLSGRVLEEE